MQPETEHPCPADPAAAFLAALDEAAYAAACAETQYRAEFAARTEALAIARAHAHRRAELMRALAATVEDAETPAMAVAGGQALLRGRLGWSQDSAARAEVLERFAAVCLALHGPDPQAEDAAAAPDADAEVAPPDPAAALAAFEDWYAATRQSAFWHLFDHYFPETPVVDF